ncbi:hypothetical protein DPMN_178947 [Dreissena polymorpha]|uniref:Uncharacterized protein n=1 Tax=Dreissena polymorpha TaxID=45954 RepID=A0A9D4IKB8_DREPO|nr:hypothetical protein DPMN_178947 [Dreissena polymorpha]
MLTSLATLPCGSGQFDILDKKINAVRDMMGMEIERIIQDLAMVVKNLSMSVIGEVHAKNWNFNKLQITNTMGENQQNNNPAADDFYKVIQRGFSSEKISLRTNIMEIFGHMNFTATEVCRIDGAIKSHVTDLSRIEQSMKNVQDKHERCK